MAIDQAQYETVRFATVEKALRWALNILNLRDWEVDLVWGEVRPDWSSAEEAEGGGCSQAHPSYYRASIWIQPKQCQLMNYHPISVLLHEVLHILLHARGIPNPHPEGMINNLESVLYRVWRAEHPRRKR